MLKITYYLQKPPLKFSQILHIDQNCHKSALEIREAAIADLLDRIGTQKVYDDITILVCKQK
ncbi:hypothetical protein [Kamptonema formosum]|uniref:hypothetical protein n=1 Tax=Kamptonema formosum TaxID=331992 RepID=UPI0011D1E904|nr:hypothetical protein [Kamptonema formosum]